MTTLAKLPPAERAKRIAALVGNPSTRANVPTKLLPQKYQAQRAMNTRLRQPIVPGSTITGRDLGRQANAAVSEKYGPTETTTNAQLAAAKQHETDNTTWYDQYLKDLQAHRDNVAGYQQTAASQIAGLNNVQGPADEAPQDAGNQSDASKAQAIRQALLGSMQGQLAARGANATTYADTLANVVGPGQKIGASQKASEATDAVRTALTALAGQKGAYRTDFEAQARSDESKNVLAGQALNLDQTKAADTAKAGRATRRETRAHDTATETAAAAKGYGPGKVGMNKYGFTYDEWTGLPPAKQDQARAGKPKVTKPVDPATAESQAFYKRYGIKPVQDPGKLGDARDQIQLAGSTIKQVLASNPTMKRGDLGPLLLTGQAAGAGGKGSPAIPKVGGIWATVALDQYYMNGDISQTTADRLHSMGYSAKGLGLGVIQPPSAHPNPPPVLNTGGTLGGFPH